MCHVPLTELTHPCLFPTCSAKRTRRRHHVPSVPLPAPSTPPSHSRSRLQTDRAPMDFADDPFKDYRYEDPFNIEDPFADATDSRQPRPTSVAGFETDDFFASNALNGSFTLPEKRSGRVSAPPVAYDPFTSRSDFKPPKPAPPSTNLTANNNTGSTTWAAWPNDNWASEDAWAKPPAQKADAWTSDDTAKRNTNTNTSDWKTDNWANKSDNWASKSENWTADWAGTDSNKNLNETWPSSTQTLPSKKEKSPRPVKYAKSLVHTIGGIGRTKQKDKKAKALEAKSTEALPTEEQQWAWAAAESRRVQAEQDARRRREDAELQLALAISRQDK